MPLNSGELSTINLNRATRAGTTVFPSIKPITLTKSNSNIVPFLSNLPDKISYQGNIQLNPLGNIGGYGDFAFYNTGLRIWADVDIPLRYTADYFLLRSNGPMSIGNSEQLDRVNSGYFRVMTDNGFPFKARLQAYLKDASGAVIDSVFIPGENTIPGGVTDGQNEVTSSTHSELIIPATKSKLEALKKAKSLEIRTYLLMPPNPPLIKIYERYKFRIKIVAELNYHAES